MSIESCKTISITKLKEWGYLNHGMKSGVISWSTAGEVHSKISIKCTILEHRKFITLDYNQNGETINYNVNIVSIPSNLGKGEILYFVCPNTGKHCRKLYHNSKYFLHREAFNYLYYEKQIHSKNCLIKIIYLVISLHITNLCISEVPSPMVQSLESR